LREIIFVSEKDNLEGESYGMPLLRVKLLDKVIPVFLFSMKLMNLRLNYYFVESFGEG